jgi:hypothetical protein
VGSLRRTVNVRNVLIAVVAGLGFAMTEMVAEAIWGRGLWSPLRFTASVFTLGRDTDPSFSIGPVLVGAVGHVIDSAIFGLIFLAVAGRFASGAAALALAGAGYGVIPFLGAWFVVLPIVDPAMLLLSAPAFLAGHVMFGLLLGLGSWLVSERASRTGQVAVQQ